MDVRVCCLDNTGEIREAAEHHAAHDKVEWVGERPVFLEVVDLEGAVWRDAVPGQCGT